MSFKLKALIASLALAVTMPASAGMDLPSSAGNSSLVFTLWNPVSGRSATFDLGPTFSTFSATTSQTFDLKDAGRVSAWNEFFAVGSNSDVKMGVIASDTTGGPTDQRFLTTGAATWESIMNTDVLSIAATVQTYINANNGSDTHNSVSNGGSFTSTTGDSDYAGNYYEESGSFGYVGYDMLGSLSSNLYLWNLNSAANGGENYTTANAIKSNVNSIDTFFSLNTTTGVLSYTVAAVPEADTSAMLLAGIGLMGFIARRRKTL